MNTNNIFADNRGGYLIPIEFDKLNFVPKRAFTISDVPKDGIRGEHAHYKTEQFLLCVRGSLVVYLDYATHKTETVLSTGQSIYIPPMVWDSQKFLTGQDFVFVLASTHYNVDDYILDKKQFYRLINGK
jgi:UDP-2-acetamido-3-amino-2,3-dideoxy-glucuronate N-acetyltransferase